MQDCRRPPPDTHRPFERLRRRVESASSTAVHRRSPVAARHSRVERADVLGRARRRGTSPSTRMPWPSSAPRVAPPSPRDASEHRVELLRRGRRRRGRHPRPSTRSTAVADAAGVRPRIPRRPARTCASSSSGRTSASVTGRRAPSQTLRRGGRLWHGFRAVAAPLVGDGVQRWSSTATRARSWQGDVDGGLDGARPAVPARRRPSCTATTAAASSATRPRTWPWTGKPTIPADGVYAGWLRASRRRRLPGGRDLGRHEPAVRRPGASGGGLRRSTRTAWTSTACPHGCRLRGPHPRASRPSLAVDGLRRPDGRGRRPRRAGSSRSRRVTPAAGPGGRRSGRRSRRLLPSGVQTVVGHSTAAVLRDSCHLHRSLEERLEGNMHAARQCHQAGDHRRVRHQAR